MGADIRAGLGGMLYLKPIGITLLLLVACASGSSQLSPGRMCASSCESRGWGRAIVGAIVIDGAATTGIEARAKFSDGVVLELDPLQCPALASPYVCTFMAYGNPSETWVDITVAVGTRTATTRVTLAGFNYCGHDIAYLPVLVEVEKPLRFGDVTFVTPCQALE